MVPCRDQALMGYRRHFGFGFVGRVEYFLRFHG
jgi:hypothetical protein